jgi:hypothetical protein
MFHGKCVDEGDNPNIYNIKEDNRLSIAFIWGEHRKLSTLGCSPHMKAITVLIYRNYSKMFKNLNVLFYRRPNIYNIKEDNRLSPGLQPLTTRNAIIILFFSVRFIHWQTNKRKITHRLTLYNYCLHMRWTSKVINPRMFTSYEGN